jgi:hypothetical protein
LGDSEVSAVQHSPGEVVKPDVGQRREYDGEIASAVGGKKSGNVLNEDIPSGPNKVVGCSDELEEEPAALALEPGPLAGDGEVLAGEAAEGEVDSSVGGGSNRRSIGSSSAGRYTASVLFFTSARAVPGLSSIHWRDFPLHVSSPWPPACQSNVKGFSGDFPDVPEAGDPGEPLGEDPSAVLVLLGLGDDPDSGLVRAEVEPADPAEERDGLEVCLSSVGPHTARESTRPPGQRPGTGRPG